MICVVLSKKAHAEQHYAICPQLVESFGSKFDLLLSKDIFQVAVEWMIEVNFKWKWTIESDDTTMTSRPVTTSYFDDMAQDDDDYQYDKIQDVKWNTQDLDVKWSDDVKWYSDMWKEGGDWFRVPPMCE